MRTAVLALVLAAAACAAFAPAAALAKEDAMRLESPADLAAALSHHDRSMHGAESPERFLERIPGHEPSFYAAEHERREVGDEADEDPEIDDPKPGDGDDPNDGTVEGDVASSRGLRDAYKTYRFRGTTELGRAQFFRFQELRDKAERGELSAEESVEMQTLRRRFIKLKKVGKFLKKTGKSLWKGVKKVGKFVGKTVKAVGAGAVAVGAASLKAANGGNKNLDEMLAQDIEDCVGCRFVWLGVELEVGNSQVEETVYDSFVKRCMEAEKAPIFFQTCQDMFDDVYGMIGDYMNGYTVNQVCEGAKMCR